jgi:hypothetical protein
MRITTAAAMRRRLGEDAGGNLRSPSRPANCRLQRNIQEPCRSRLCACRRRLFAAPAARLDGREMNRRTTESPNDQTGLLNFSWLLFWRGLAWRLVLALCGLISCKLFHWASGLDKRMGKGHIGGLCARASTTNRLSHYFSLMTRCLRACRRKSSPGSCPGMPGWSSAHDLTWWSVLV